MLDPGSSSLTRRWAEGPAKYTLMYTYMYTDMLMYMAIARHFWQRIVPVPPCTVPSFAAAYRTARHPHELLRLLLLGLLGLVLRLLLRTVAYGVVLCCA